MLEPISVLKASDISLVKNGDVFTLVIAGQPLPLDPSGFAKLCRIGNIYKHLVNHEADSGPPYVVSVCIPYLDCDADQTTQSWNTAFGFQDPVTAKLAIPALETELDSMGFVRARGWYSSDATEVKLERVPEDDFYDSDIEDVTDIGEALTLFRYQVATESSHYPSDEWFEMFGFENKWSLPEGLDAESFRLNKLITAEEDS